MVPWRRSALFAALVVFLSVVSTTDAISAVSRKYSFPDHQTRQITLATTPASTNVKYRIVRNVFPWAGSPHATDGAGTIDVPAGWVKGSFLPVDYMRVSKQVYMQKGGSYGAKALEKKDIYPRYGDHRGSWLSQSGDNNFVKVEFPHVRQATEIKIYETLNPGGVFRVKIHSPHGETMSVFTEGAPNFSRHTEHNGASVMTIHFEAPHFDIAFVTVYVDASAKWRGIDAIEVAGLKRERADVPGDMFGNKLNFVPFAEKKYGCDGFSFVAHDGKGGEWTNRANVKVCYGCPKNKQTGQICSGVGKCNMAECICEVGFKGDACEKSQCPRMYGKICGGKGTCVSGQCRCFQKWTGNVCQNERRMARCATCNDPHYTSFDGARFSYYQSGESLAFEWRESQGPKLVVAQHLRNCGSRAYRQSWSPISCVDGMSIRYGDDIVTWKCTNALGRAAGNYINCGRVGNSGAWRNIGPNGLQARFPGGSMQVRIGDWFNLNVNCGCFNLVTSIPRLQENSNKIVGMCGNHDGIARNDAGGAVDWLDVPRFPRDALNPLPSANWVDVKRARAIAWGKFFEPSPNCDLWRCKKCSSYLNYNAFPLKYDGKLNYLQTNIASASKIEKEMEAEEKEGGITDEQFVKKDIHDPVKNENLVTMMSTMVKATTEDHSNLKEGRVGVDGDAIPADVDVHKLPSHVIGSKYSILYKCMSMKTCLKFIGTPEFDSCVWDAISLNSKAGGGLSEEQAVTKSTEMNLVRSQAKAKALKEEKEMKEAIEEKEKIQERNAGD